MTLIVSLVIVLTAAAHFGNSTVRAIVRDERAFRADRRMATRQSLTPVLTLSGVLASLSTPQARSDAFWAGEQMFLDAEYERLAAEPGRWHGHAAIAYAWSKRPELLELDPGAILPAPL